MNILVINSGSSSLKYELINMDKKETLAKGICERIGIQSPIFTYKNLTNGYKIDAKQMDIPNHEKAIKILLDALLDSENGVISKSDEINAIGHRMVHGGETYKDSVLIKDSDVQEFIELSDLAPLHNPPAVKGIQILRNLLPNVPNVAVFDTSFHQTMPDYAYRYPLPKEDYTELKIRKYGAHGTSHKFVGLKVQELLNNKKDSKIIVCHLGNGASISAIKDGKVIDTSMGFTPLAGLMMGTRCGDIDPSIPEYLMNKRNLTISEVNTRMNKKSGFLGVSTISSDFRDIASNMEKGNADAKLAFEMFCYRVRNFIGSYIVALGGVDAIAFTGGIGENAYLIREKICENLEFLGIELDYEKNKERISGNVEYSKPTSKTKIYKIETNEELMIALDTERLYK